MKVSIPMSNIGVLQERMAKMEAKADSLGVAFPTISYSDTYVKQTKDLVTGQVHKSYWVDVTVEGQGISSPVSYGGWEIIGSYNHEYPTGVIVNRLVSDINPEFDAKFEAKNVSHCDHCKRTMRRLNTYVIRKVGETQQMLVGSSCMHDYVPNQKPLDQVIAYYQCLDKALFGDLDNEEERGPGYQYPYQPTQRFLTVAFAAMLSGVNHKSEGFFELVMSIMNHDYDKDDQVVRDIFTHLEDADSEIPFMLERTAELPDDGDFNTKLKRIAASPFYRPRDGKVLLWAAVRYFYYLFPEKDPKSLKRVAKVNEWVGVVGEVLDTEVTYIGETFLYSSQYGDQYLYTFVDKVGHVITWKTNQRDMSEMAPNNELRARVKEHTEFKGTKQTQVIRPRFTPISITA